MPPKLIIRADANASIGAGHLMRCLALAQAWNANAGSITFITTCDSDKLLARLRSEGIEVVHLQKAYPAEADLDVTKKILKAHSKAWLAIDGYHFDYAYHRSVKEAGHPLLVIDDTAHLDTYFSDFLLNQNIYANQLDYPCKCSPTFFLGPRYALLRQEFMAWQEFKRHIPRIARKLLVSFGGSDPNNVTVKVVKALNRLPHADFEVKIVVGASYPYLDSLRAVCRNSKHSIMILQNVTDMPYLMSWADLSVAAGGSTCLELLFMKLPGITIITAENQRLNWGKPGESNPFLNLGHHEEVSPEMIAEALHTVMQSRSTREKMKEQCGIITDGKGARRVVDTLLCHTDVGKEGG